MATVVAGALAGGGGLFSYNRDNFMFDKELLQKREYQAQDLRIKQFQLYREDVRDLVDLTVSKMDIYLVVNTLQLGFCVILFTEGRPRTISEPWLTWLYSLNTVGALLYFLLSVWLSLHASIAAHSFGVRLLTQFVRLPVPNRKQIDAARAKATEFEGSSGTSLFRVPVLRQQLQRLNNAMGDLTAEDNPAEASVEQSAARAEADAAQQHLVTNPAAMTQHVQLYRDLQANWQAYDAYARVCMAVGTNQLLHALGYYILIILIVENKAPMPAFACVIIFTFAAWLLARMDLFASRQVIWSAGALLLLSPLFTLISITVEKAELTEEWKDFTDKLLFPLTFFLHLIWMCFLVWVAKADQTGDVHLPSKFRSVLYLDVFGWLGSEKEDGAASGAATPRADRPTPSFGIELSDRTPPPPGSASLEQLMQEHDAEGSRPMPLMKRGSVENRAELLKQLKASAVMLPPNLRAGLSSLCWQIKDAVQEDLTRWESEKVKFLLKDDFSGAQILQTVKSFRGEFFEVMHDLQEADPDGKPLEKRRSVIAQEGGAEGHEKVWLQLDWEVSGAMWEYYYNPVEEQTVWTRPEPPDRVSDLDDLKSRIDVFKKKVTMLVEFSPEREDAVREELPAESLELVMPELEPHEGPWSVHQHIRVAREGEEHLLCKKTMFIAGNITNSVSTAVERLNNGEIRCPEGSCIVFSSSGKAYYVLYREDMSSVAQSRFDPIEELPEERAAARGSVSFLPGDIGPIGAPEALGPSQEAASSISRAISPRERATKAVKGAANAALGRGTGSMPADYKRPLMDEHASTQEMRFGGSEAVNIRSSTASHMFSHAAGASTSFHPHASTPEADAAPAAARRPPGQMPWSIFWQGSLAIISMWFIGTVCVTLDVVFDLNIPIWERTTDDPDHAAASSRLLGAVEPVHSGQAGFRRLAPKSIACHPGLGSKILIAEKYAVFELPLDSEPGTGQPRLVLEACLSEVPDFHANGIRGISVECDVEHAQDSHCTALLHSAGDRGVLRCPLPQVEGQEESGTLVRLHGGNWRALAAGASAAEDGSVWALDGRALVRLGARPGAEEELVPRLKVSNDFADGVEDLHALGDHSVFGLDPRGVMHAWSSKGQFLESWRLPDHTSWSSACGVGGHLYLAGPSWKRGEAGLWRAELPAYLAEGERAPWALRALPDESHAVEGVAP